MAGLFRSFMFARKQRELKAYLGFASRWRWCTSKGPAGDDRRAMGNGMAQSTGLMHGKRGVILGVANNRSIAWGIAKACRAAGAEIALTW